MLLALDIGNTNMVMGFYENSDLKNRWRLSTNTNKSVDEYGILMKNILEVSNLDIRKIKSIIISSVVPDVTTLIVKSCIKYLNIEPIVVGPGIKTGMNIEYDNPKSLGSDRLVNCVSGYHKYGGPLIVVDMGTAITIDAVDDKGVFLGGTISPGVQISAEGLFNRTSKLPRVEITEPKEVIGINTIESIQSGFYYGYVGLCDYIIEKIIEELSSTMDVTNITVIATGGFSKLLAKKSKYIDIIDPQLTLDGLSIIYNLNQNNKVN